MNNHETAMKVIAILIDSELSISNQLQVIKMVKERIDFCKSTGRELTQLKLEL
jgi:hypothetical protein